jgi:hypothetical protein
MGVGSPAVGGDGGGLKVVGPGGCGEALGWAAGTKRVAAEPPFGKERMTAAPGAGAAGGGAATGAFGSGSGAGGALAAEPIGAPQEAQAFAPGSL